MADELLFKKYSNRRLYDTEKSTYVSLSHVADMTRQGRHVKVIDAKTEEDVTAFILAQIILEEARKRNNLLPVPLLHLIIQYGENILAEFFDKYLEQTIKNYLAYKETFDEQFRKWLELGMDFSAMAEKTMSGFTPSNPFFDLFSKPISNQQKKENEE